MNMRRFDRVKASFATGIVISSLLLAFGAQGTASAVEVEAAASEQTINIVNAPAPQNYAFSPLNVTVVRGDTVTWPNQTGVRHFIYNGTQHIFDQNVEAGATGTWNTSGQALETYPYVCLLHPEMLDASITLVASMPTPTPTPTPNPGATPTPTPTPNPNPTPTPTPVPTPTPAPTPTPSPTPGETPLPDLEFTLVESASGKFDIDPPSATVALGQKMVFTDTTTTSEPHFIQREDHADNPTGPGHQTLWFQQPGPGEQLTLTYGPEDQVAGRTLVLECVVHTAEYGGPMETVITITGEGGSAPTPTADVTLPPTDVTPGQSPPGGSGTTGLAILLLSLSAGLGAATLAARRARTGR